MAPSPGAVTPPRTSHEQQAPRLSSSSSSHGPFSTGDPPASRLGTPAAAARSRPTTPLAATIATPKAHTPASGTGIAGTPAGSAPSVAFAGGMNVPGSAAETPPAGIDLANAPAGALEAVISFADRLSRANTARRPPPITPPSPPATPPVGGGSGAAVAANDERHDGDDAAGAGSGDAAAPEAPAAEESHVQEVVEAAAPGAVVGLPPLVDDALDAQVNPPSLEHSSLADYATAADHWLLTDSKLEQYDEFVARGLLMVRNMARSDPRFAVTSPANWLTYARDSLVSKHGLIRAAAASALAAFAASAPGRDAIQKDPLALTRAMQMLTHGIAAGCDNTDTQYASLALASIALNTCMRQPLLRHGILQRSADVLRAAVRLLGGNGGGSTSGASGGSAASATASGGGGGSSTGGGGGAGGSGRRAAVLLKAAAYIVALLTCLSIDSYGRDQLEVSGLARLTADLQERATAVLGHDHPLSRRLALLAEAGSAAELLEEMGEDGGAVAAAGGGGGGHGVHAVGWDLPEDAAGPAARSTPVGGGGGGGAVSLQRGVSFADGLGRGAGGAGAGGAGRATAAISALQKLVDPEGARAAASGDAPAGRGLISQFSIAARSMTRKASMAASAAAAAASAAASSAAASLTPRGEKGGGQAGQTEPASAIRPAGRTNLSSPGTQNGAPTTSPRGGGAAASSANATAGGSPSDGGYGGGGVTTVTVTSYSAGGTSSGGTGSGGMAFLSRCAYVSESGLAAFSGIGQSLFGSASPPSPPVTQQQHLAMAPPAPSSSMQGVHFSPAVFADAVAARNAAMAEDLSNNRRRASMTTYLSQLVQSSKSVRLPSVVGFGTGAARAMSAVSHSADGFPAAAAQAQALGRSGSGRSVLSLSSPPPPQQHHLHAHTHPQDKPQTPDERGAARLFAQLHGGGHAHGHGHGQGQQHPQPQPQQQQQQQSQQGVALQPSPTARPRSGVSVASLRSQSVLLGDVQRQRPTSQLSHKSAALTESGTTLSPTGNGGGVGGGIRSGCNSPLVGRQESGRFELPFHLVRSQTSTNGQPIGAGSKVFRLTAVSPSRRPSINGAVNLQGLSRMYTSPEL